MAIDDTPWPRKSSPTLKDRTYQHKPDSSNNVVIGQKPQTNLTPGRVAQSMLGLLSEIGTPAVSPKLRGNSSGWEKGRKRNQRTRYPIVKKGFSRSKP